MTSTAIALRAPGRSSSYLSRLLGVMEQLEELEADLLHDGLEEEAGSLATMIADFEWQYEELATTSKAG